MAQSEKPDSFAYDGYHDRNIEKGNDRVYEHDECDLINTFFVDTNA